MCWIRFYLEDLINLIYKLPLLLLIMPPENNTSVVKEEAVGISRRIHVHPHMYRINIRVDGLQYALIALSQHANLWITVHIIYYIYIYLWSIFPFDCIYQGPSV